MVDAILCTDQGERNKANSATADMIRMNKSNGTESQESYQRVLHFTNKQPFIQNVTTFFMNYQITPTQTHWSDLITTKRKRTFRQQRRIEFHIETQKKTQA